jgi:hypothetical protein
MTRATDVVEGIDSMIYSGIAHSSVQKGVNPLTGQLNTGPGPEPGDVAHIEGVVLVNSFQDNDGQYTGVNMSITALGLNSTMAGGWEMTGIYETDLTYVFDLASNRFGFVHTPSDRSYLRLYVDGLGPTAVDGGEPANQMTGQGFADGQLVASFVDLNTGDLIVIDPMSLSLPERGSFALNQSSAGWAYSNDEAGDGNAMGAELLGAPPIVQRMELDSTIAADFQLFPTMWTTVFPQTQLLNVPSQLNLFVREMGTATIAVPELTPFALIVFFALSITLRSRRYRI